MNGKNLNWEDATLDTSNLLDFYENTTALWRYWDEELARYKRWVATDEHWIRCHPEEDIASRKGFIRVLRKELKRRKSHIKFCQKRIVFVKAMLREIDSYAEETNELS